jgi:predicted permease
LGYGAVVLSAIVLVLAMFVAGRASVRAGIFDETAADVLNRFVVYVALPALVLRIVPELRWERGLLVLVVVPWLLLFVAAGACLILARAFDWPRPVRGALLLCAPLGNTSFLGLPLIAALRGEHAMRHALIYDQFGSFLALSSYGLAVLARYSGESPPSASTVARRVVRFPPFIALLLALVPWSQPSWLSELFARIGATLVPLAMFAVGMRLRLELPAERSALWAGLAVKMLLSPLCAWAFVRALGAHDLAAQVAVLEAAMPPMLTAAALASVAGLAPRLCAALAGYGILIAFVLLPLWAAVL